MQFNSHEGPGVNTIVYSMRNERVEDWISTDSYEGWCSLRWLAINFYSTRAFIKAQLSSAYLCVSYALLSRLLTSKARNWLVFPPIPCLTPPHRGDPLEFVDETYSAKITVMGLPYGKNMIPLPPTVFEWSNRVTDRWTGDSIGR